MTQFELTGLLKKLRPLASDKMTVDVPPPKTSRARADPRALGCGPSWSPKSLT
jgi:hypothetical protein